jgi:hypothetical protein
VPFVLSEDISDFGFGTESGSAVGDLVVSAVSLDLDHGLHPRPVRVAVGGASTERLGDVARRVLDDARDLSS